MSGTYVHQTMQFRESDVMAPQDADQIDRIEKVFRRVDREIWVITSRHGQDRGGLVATWVSQASIDRETPSLVIGIAPNHFTADLVLRSGRFAAHLISKSQLDIAWNFAIGSGRDRDKLANLSTESGISGAPILTDCLAWLDCRVFARLDAGDRLYFWSDVLAAGENDRDSRPLTEQQLLAAANQQQRAELLANRDADIAVQRPLLEKWRAALPEHLIM